MKTSVMGTWTQSIYADTIRFHLFSQTVEENQINAIKIQTPLYPIQPLGHKIIITFF